MKGSRKACLVCTLTPFLARNKLSLRTMETQLDVCTICVGIKRLIRVFLGRNYSGNYKIVLQETQKADLCSQAEVANFMFC